MRGNAPWTSDGVRRATLMPFWYWAAIGAVLGVIEVAIPAMVCIWLATAALGVAAIAWRYPGLAWEHQALITALAVNQRRPRAHRLRARRINRRR
jgi:membrane protein implicated in regulation of membrane protease activity